MNKHTLRLTGLALASALALAACGGSSNSGGTRVTTSKVYVMGDSLADSGTFGFKFTTQQTNEQGQPILTGEKSTRLWVDYIADVRTKGKQPMLCNAVSINKQTGAITPNPGCTNFAIGGALAGPANGATSVVDQMKNAGMAARSNGGFKPDELVLVDGGANDMATLLGKLAAYRNSSVPNAIEVERQLGALLTAPDPASAAAALTQLVPALQQANAAASSAQAQALMQYLDSVIGAGQTAATLQAQAPANTNAITAAVTGIQTALQAGNLQTAKAIAGQLKTALEARQDKLQQTIAALGVQFAQKLATLMAGGIQENLVANGAKRVAVLNLPAIQKTPLLRASLEDAATGQPNATGQLLAAVMTAYNRTLQTALEQMPNETLYIDFYSEFMQQIDDKIDPKAGINSYGMGNTTDALCKTALNPDGTTDYATTWGGCSFVAAAAAQGKTPAEIEKQKHVFSDSFHPTALAHNRIAQLISRELSKRGW